MKWENLKTCLLDHRGSWARAHLCLIFPPDPPVVLPLCTPVSGFCWDSVVMVRRWWPSDRSCGRGRWRGLREGSCCRPSWGHTLAARSCDGSSWGDQLERIRQWTWCPWQVTATGNRGYLHPTHNEKRSGHVTGPFIFKQVSPREEELWTQGSKTISHLHWKPKLPLSSLHRVSHSDSSLFENLSLKFVRFHLIVYNTRNHLHSHVLSSL